jgi:hypothetical protein
MSAPRAARSRTEHITNSSKQDLCNSLNSKLSARSMTTSRPFQVNEYGNTNEQKAGSVPLAEYLAGFHIIVNCVLQDTDAPLMFVTDEELALFRPGIPGQ